MLLRDKVYIGLRDQIVDGTLPPGAVLHLPALAGQLQVSRTPVREALRRLADERLVETEASRWTRVAPLDIDSAVKLYPVRWTLEALAIRRSAPFAPPELMRLERANSELSQALSRRDGAAACAADHAFHLALIEPSDNEEIISIVELIQARLVRFALAYWNEGTIGVESCTEHGDVSAHIRAHDHERAAQAIEKHWQSSLRRMQPVYERGVRGQRVIAAGKQAPAT